DRVVAQLRLGYFEEAGHGLLDDLIAGERPHVQLGERDVPAAAFEADVQNRLSLLRIRHGKSPGVCTRSPHEFREPFHSPIVRAGSQGGECRIRTYEPVYSRFGQFVCSRGWVRASTCLRESSNTTMDARPKRKFTSSEEIAFNRTAAV